MPFIVPSFNLTCNLWTWPAALGLPAPPAGAPRVAGQVCALVYGRRISGEVVSASALTPPTGLLMHLLLPAGTDARGTQDTVGRDVCECPAGSGRYYLVGMVDDIGKGWANEHRTATLTAYPASWVAPYP